MANPENVEPYQIKTLSSEEAARRGRNGARKSAQSKRNKKKLKERIKLALEISTNENLKSLKRRIRELWPLRHSQATKEDLRLKLAQAKTIKECGYELYQLLHIGQNPITDNSDKIKIIQMLWDREEGKPMTKNENKEVKEFSDEVEYLD